MKVAFIHPDLGIGGAERLVVDAAVGLQALGHNVTMFTSHHDPNHCFEETRNGTLKVIVRGRLPQPRWLRSFSLIFAILRQFYLVLTLYLQWLMGQKEAYYDVFFVDQLSFGIPILKQTGAKIFFYGHFPDKLLSPRTSLLKGLYRLPLDWVEEITTGMADKIVTNSRFTSGVFETAFSSLRMKTDVLYPGIQMQAYSHKVDLNNPSVRSIAKFVYSTACFSDFNATLLSTRKRKFVSINRFERKKNIELAVLAFSRLKQKISHDLFRDLQLVIAGGYDKRVHENVEYHRDLERLATEQGLSSSTCWPSPIEIVPDLDAQVLFIPSFNNAQRQYLLTSSLCLVYTPSGEHFGIVPIEAMASRLPVLAVNSGGPLETVVEGVGWLGDPSAEAFSELLEVVLSMTESERLKIGLAGEKWARDMFSLDAFASKLDRMLKELHNANRHRRDAWRRSIQLSFLSFVVFVVAHRVAALFLF